jgi:hypothetical protein
MTTNWHWLQIRRAKRFTGPVVANQTLYGVNTFEPPYLAAHANVITTAQSMGVQVIRTGLTWSNMQTTVGGSIDWSEYDDIYSRCVAAHITPIFVIETTPIAYNTSPYGFFNGSQTVFAIPTVTDPKFTQWVSDQAAWAAQVVVRYPKALFEWWNEWASASGYWRENDVTANKPTVSAYATAYMACYSAMKAANPACTVAVGGLTAVTFWSGSNATTGVNVVPLLTGTGGFVTDAWSIHPYTHDSSNPNPALDNYPTSNSFDDIARFQTAMIANGQGSKPLWVTEWGQYSAAAIGSESLKAGYVTTSLNYIRTKYGTGIVGATNAGVRIATIYPLIDSSSSPTDTGLVGPATNGPYTLHTSGTSYQAFTHALPSITPVATTVFVAPSSFTISTIGGTQALTATVLDQFRRVMTSPTVTWSSSNNTIATVNSSTGVVTSVANGSATITATSGSATGTSAATVNTVSSVSIFYNSQPALPMLFRIGSTYTLVAKDQSGNVLSGSVGTWSSSDATNAPIGASTGIAAPNASLTGSTFTYTHTASGHTGTASATVLPATTTIVSDQATNYANDAAFRAAISSGVTTGTYTTPAPTGGGGSLYTDGVNEALITLDATRLFMGSKSFLMTFPGGEQSYTWLASNFAAGHTNIARAWALVVKRYDSGFTPVGSGVGGAASYKDFGMVWGNEPSGAGRITYTNTTDIDVSADVVSSGSLVGGFSETKVGNETTEWSSQNWFADVYLYEAISVSLMSARLWRFYLGNNPNVSPLLSPTVIQGACNAGVTLALASGLQPFGINYNQTRNVGQILYKNIGYYEAVDGVVYGDPYGLLNDTSTPTLTGISGGTVTHGTNNNSIVLTGTNFTVNCWPSFSNAKIYPQSVTVNSTTQITVVVNVDATATTGAGTVSITNNSSQHTTSTQVVTVV